MYRFLLGENIYLCLQLQSKIPRNSRYIYKKIYMFIENLKSRYIYRKIINLFIENFKSIETSSEI